VFARSRVAVAAEVERRQQRRTGDAQLCIRLLDAGDAPARSSLLRSPISSSSRATRSSSSRPPAERRRKPHPCHQWLVPPPAIMRQRNVRPPVGRAHAAAGERRAGQSTRARERTKLPFHDAPP
jgi:hypothetical protein